MDDNQLKSGILGDDHTRFLNIFYYIKSRLTIFGSLFIGFYFILTYSSYGNLHDSLNHSENLTDFNSYHELYNQLIRLEPDENRMCTVQDFTFKRDVGKFSLDQGELYLLSPINGRTVAAIFTGNGSVVFKPPTKIEREQLYRFYEVHSLEKDFNILFMIFADSTLSEFEKHLNFHSGEIKDGVKNKVENCLEYLSDKDGKYFDTSILKSFFDQKQNDLFYAHFSNNKSDPMFFKIDPYEIEEVRLLHRAETLRFYKIPEVVCQFPKQTENKSKNNLDEEGKDLINILQYKIESTIKNNLKFSAITEMEFAALEPDQKWVFFNMFSDMIVDSVKNEEDKKLTFFKNKNNPILWIRFDPALPVHTVKRLKLFYHGDLMDRNDEGWVYIKNSTGWYPKSGVRKTATFDLTYHTPKDFKFVSVGEKLSCDTLKDVVTTHWITPKPIRNASFNIGFYQQYKIEDERIPPVTVYKSAYGHRQIGQYLGSQGITSGSHMEKKVGADVANSIAFYQYVFGDCPVKHFYATETPFLHGLAFPGLIHLAWTTFQRTDEYGHDEIFRGHEVAHQWWGIEVDFKTYHDQWLSEGFATYAGLWYMQTALKDNKKFFDMLKDYRDKIINNRKFLFGSGQESGPICLGYRTSSSKTEGDYNLIIYWKGAWVLHMLRNMLIDLKTMNEDRFTNILKDFYNTYRGRLVSTHDFQETVEKHIGMNMDWFFKQWIDGTDIPKYIFSYKVQKNKDGKYLVHCRIKQEEVPEDFKMYNNMFIDFGDDQFARIRILIDKPFNEFDLPLLPLKPKKIILNDLESVLCEAKNEKWKE